MDNVPNWKKILLDWINNSGLLQKNYISLEQTDINEFFTKFMSNIHNLPKQYEDVVCFLKAQYENFEIHLDDENQLSSTDYMYCYSLLLHYCCVKNPNEYFHKVCQNLPELHQQAFTKLFSGLLETDLINKTNLRHVIGDASPRQLPQNTHDSPIMKIPSNLKFSPTTPKSNMLEERTKELHILRAQLDTERYDKSLLEMQLKQNEEKMKQITHQQRKYLSEIQKLKNDVLYQNGSENCSPNKSHNENQIRNRLLKQMAEKEEESLTIKENNIRLIDDQRMLQERLKLSDKEVSRLNQKILGMEDKFLHFNKELEKKNYEIRILNEEKIELKQVIDESRSISNGRDLNFSIECLDSSMSRDTSSSGSINSPENLGASVIDIQLREKIIENTQLNEEIEQLKYENKSLSKNVCTLLKSNSDIFEICNENLLANDAEGNNLTQIFLVFDNYVKKLIENYTHGKLAIKRLNDEQNTLNMKNYNLMKQISELEESVTKLSAELIQFDQEKFHLESANDSLKINQNELNNKIKVLTTERETYLSTIKDLKLKIIKTETERNNDSNKFSQQINDISKDILEKTKKNEELENDNKALSSQIIEFKNNLLESNKNYENSKDTCCNLEQLKVKLEHDIKELSKEISVLKDKLKEKELIEKENVKLNGYLKEKSAENQLLENKNFDLNEMLKENQQSYSKSIEELTEKIKHLEAGLILKEKFIKDLNNIISIKTEENLRSDEEIQKITNDILNIRTDRNNLENKLKNYDVENIKLTENLESLEKKLMESEVLSNKLNIENAKLSKSCEDSLNIIKEFKESLENVRSSLTTRENELKSLEIQYNVKIGENNKLHEKYEEFVKKLKEMEKKNQQLIDENKELNKTNDLFKQQLNDVQAQSKKLKESKCILEKYKIEVDETNSNLQTEILDLNKLLAERRDCIENIKSSNNCLERENSQHVKTIDEINNLLSVAEKSIKAQKYEISTLELKLKDKSNDNLRLEDQCTQLANKLSEIVQKQDRVLEKLSYLTNGSNNETDDIENLLTALDEQKSELTDQIKKKDEENSKYRCDLEEKIKNLSELLQEKVDIQNDLNHLKQLYDKKCLEISNLNNQNEYEIKNILDEIRNKSSLNFEFHSHESLTHENLMNSIKIILDSNSDLINKISTLDEKIKLLSGNIENENAAKLLWEKEKFMLIEETELLNMKIRDLHEKINKTNLSSEEENIKLKSSISNCEQEIEILKKEIVSLKEKAVQLELLNNAANIKINEIQKEVEFSLIELESKAEECLTLKDNLTNAKENLENMQNNIKNITAEKTNIASELTKLSAEHKSKINDYIVLNERFKKMELYRTQLETDLEKTKKDLENQTNSHTKEILLLETKVLKTQEQIHFREQNILNLQEELNSVSDKNKKLATDLDVATVQLAKEIESFNDNLKKNKEFGNKILLLEQNIKESEEKLENYKHTSSEQLKELKEVQMKFEKLEKANSELNKNIDRYEEDAIQLNKKLEKNSIRLGEYQSKASKLEKENTQLKKEIESTKSNVDGSQREQIKLQTELKNIKEKFQKSEDKKAEINDEKCKLEENINQVKEQLSKALSNEMELRDKFKLEVANITNDNKFFEKKNIELTHEIGGLNKVIEDFKKSEFNLKNEFAENMRKLEADSNDLKNINEKLKSELEDVKKMKIKAEDSLSKTMIQLNSLQSNLDNAEVELNNLQQIFDEVQAKNEALENENLNTLKQLEELKSIELENKTKNLKTTDMEKELVKYVAEIDIKEEKIIKMSQQFEELKVKDSKELEDASSKLCELKNQYDELKHLYENEIESSEQLKKDVKIFEAKLYKSRQKTEQNEKKWNEEKIKLLSEKKENRVELEGKLEKMKTKMKTLYNDEVEKLKSKYNREIFDYQAQLQVVEHKKEKFEEHCQKLSKQVFNLNEQIKVLERDHKFMETKLKDYEQHKSHTIKRPQPNKTFTMAPPSNSITNKFQMEDEEGEIFNNTYLTDLKDGRMSDFGLRDSISVKEMQYRNSLAPPHLRSTYLAQYKEHNLPENDIKDVVPVNLDDSLSSLLNADKRKKLAGTTSYKKPGPPTPGKTAGRLSFGGNNEVQSSILKESNDDKKTPAKFKFFSSKGPKDENPQKSASSKQVGRRNSNNFKPITRHLHLGFQSSTPRKSKIRFHPIHALEQYSQQNNEESEPNNLNARSNTSQPFIETPQNSSNFKKWRQKKIVYNSATTSDSNSPFVNESGKISKKKNNRRVSIYDHGNIYSKSKPSRRNESHIQKAKLARAKNFNKYRRSLHEVNLRNSLLSQNNNYDSKTLFPTTISSITTHNDDERFSNIIGNQLLYDMDVTLNNDNKIVQGHRFEKLIQEIQSTAPFEVNSNTFNIDTSQQLKLHSNNTIETNIELSTNGSVISGTSTSHSKTLYPSNIIVNRKIPYLNKTEINIRKSSFYIKNGNVILRPNAMLTIKDLFEMRNRITVDVKIIFLLCIIIIIFFLSYAISWMRGN